MTAILSKPSEVTVWARDSLPEPVQPIEVVPIYGHETPELIDYLVRTAEAADVDPTEVRTIIYCESEWGNVQSKYMKNGKREDSHGLAQIHLPSHPEVTRAEAYDPHYAIDFIVEHVKRGKYIWYAYDRKHRTCANSLRASDPYHD